MLLRLLYRSVRRQFASLGFESRTFMSSSGSLHYLVRDHPDAKGTIILVHGLGTSSSSWIKTLKHLKLTHRIVALDLPGFGFSTPHPARGFNTLEEHVDALTQLVAAVGQTSFVLVGQSLGGWISARYAARFPQRVQHLVLIDTAGVEYPGVESLRDLFTLTSVEDTRRLLRSLWYRYPWYFKPFAGSIYRELMSRKMNELVTSIDRNDFLSGELALLRMPVTIIWGKQDGAISVESVDILKEKIPHAAAHLIDHCGHVPQLEAPEILAGILNEVLES
jgi:abhydrolase domain-containing protein 6